ncbi:phospholipase A1 [Vigna unguiculata]|uniref:Phospholipase A1 n=1 Tax=Vigna unguiculata TaxID=3917 RepID=A0A4D6N031_VIGUN|nr:phospholipase A1 [Vigna unguiculata]
MAMAAPSISNMFFPFPKTRQLTFSLPYSKLNTPLTRTQNSIKLGTRENSSTSTVREQEHEEATTHTHNYKPKLEEHLKRLPEAWRQIQGEDDWAGLLEPMDPLMRMEMIRYGEMAQACYDAFDFDPFSKYCGSCRFVVGYIRLSILIIGCICLSHRRTLFVLALLVLWWHCSTRGGIARAVMALQVLAFSLSCAMEASSWLLVLLV